MVDWTALANQRNGDAYSIGDCELDVTTESPSESRSLSSSSPAPCIPAIRLRFHCIVRSSPGSGWVAVSVVVIVKMYPGGMTPSVSQWNRYIFPPRDISYSGGWLVYPWRGRGYNQSIFRYPRSFRAISRYFQARWNHLACMARYRHTETWAGHIWSG